MAIDLNEKKEINFSISRVVIIVIIIIFVIAIFLIINKNSGTVSNGSSSERMFEPINIDFSFITSESFDNLQKFQGIPVLPGFFEASDQTIEIEKIEYGRDNPFSDVSSEEIELAVLKVIQKLDTFNDIEEMRSVITSSSLYTDSQKEIFNTALDEQSEAVEETMLEENTPVEIINEQKEQSVENIQNGEVEIILDEEQMIEDVVNEINGNEEENSDNLKEW